jgi:hypothetical protein
MCHSSLYLTLGLSLSRFSLPFSLLSRNRLKLGGFNYLFLPKHL